MVSVILPVYRNAKTLPELVARLGAALQGRGAYELVLVIDASPDESAAVAAGLAAGEPRVKVIELAKNVGQSRAILTGMAYARAEVAVVMDADLQDPPEAVPGLVQRMEYDASLEALFATRVNRYSSRGRHMTSRLFKGAMRALSGGRIPKNAGLFFAVRREAYARMAERREWDVHLVGLIARVARRIGAVPVTRAGSESGSYTSAMRLEVAWKSVRTLLGVPRKAARRVEVRRTVNVELGQEAARA
jgi:glycosyltransferase involved in cell wall biosynthesis